MGVHRNYVLGLDYYVGLVLAKKGGGKYIKYVLLQELQRTDELQSKMCICDHFRIGTKYL